MSRVEFNPTLAKPAIPVEAPIRRAIPDLPNPLPERGLPIPIPERATPVRSPQLPVPVPVRR